MGRRRCKTGRVLLAVGISILVLSFCSFKFICVALAVLFIIIGTRLVICS